MRSPLSRTLKPQLLEEAMRLGMTVHPKWTVVELRAVIREHKAATGDSDLSKRMRKINSLNLPELREKATRARRGLPRQGDERASSSS